MSLWIWITGIVAVVTVVAAAAAVFSVAFAASSHAKAERRAVEATAAEAARRAVYLGLIREPASQARAEFLEALLAERGERYTGPEDLKGVAVDPAETAQAAQALKDLADALQPPGRRRGPKPA
ncbi:MAG TPA: hypothetical protein VEH31_22420 [Streptosporangiaceae bacterium]|nr:hypothetical protein [Streptosporangiaceae bacterium]